MRAAVGVLIGILVIGSATFAAEPECKSSCSIEFARGLIEAEQFEKAVGILKRLNAEDSVTTAQIDNLLGRIYLAIGKPAKALGFFEEASFASLNGEAESYLGLAEANLALGNLALARTNAAVALKTDPDLVAAHLVLAMADHRVGRGAEALSRLRKLQQERPDDEDVAIVLARYVANQEGAERGAAELENFAARMPTSATAQDILGQLYWASGRKKDAVLARILAKELYEANNQTGRAAAMAAWLKAVDPNGQYEQAAKAPDLPKPSLQHEHRVIAVPNNAPPPEAAITPPAHREQPDEPPPPAAAPRPIVKAMPISMLPISPDPLPFAPGSAIMTGSGIVLEGGRLIITNRHVVEGMNSVAVRNGTGHVRTARIVKLSDDDDLALLEIDKPFPEGAVTPISDIEDPATGRAASHFAPHLVALFQEILPEILRIKGEWDGIVSGYHAPQNIPGVLPMAENPE